MFSPAVQNLITRHVDRLRKKEIGHGGNTPRIQVDEIATKVATFYDKVRNVIEYHDAHLLRKKTIERVLNRRLLLKTFDKDFAESLIKELIRSGHLPNNSVPETKIEDVRVILANLFYLLEHSGSSEDHSDWIIKIFIPAIEEELFPPPETVLLAEAMREVIRGNLVLKNISLSPEEIDTQLLIAAHRALFRADKDQLHYLLLKSLYPGWGKMPEATLREVAGRLGELRRGFDAILRHPAGPYFLKLCTKEKIVMQLTGDVVFSDIPLDRGFDAKLRSSYDDRHGKASAQLRRLAFWSVLSFFISKIVVALAVEIPLDRYLYQEVAMLGIIINILFPPLLMCLIVLFTRPPSPKNFNLVANAVKSVMYAGKERDYMLKFPKRKGFFPNLFVYVAYTATFCAILYYLIDLLRKLHFSPVSIVIFVLFTSMVIATGVKVRNRAKEMSLEPERATFLGFLVDLIMVPFTTLGRWIIAGIAKFNFLVIAIDFLIELPFQFFVELLENFREMIKAKKEEIS